LPVLRFNASAARVCALVIASVAVLAGCVLPAGASAATSTRSVSYDGYRLTVPASWPVYRLSAHSAVCVRFNRHAVYLGQPSVAPRCPADALGRTEAILVQPRALSQAPMTSSVAGAEAAGGSVARIADPHHGVVVTATWRSDPAVVARALGVRSLSRLAVHSVMRPARYSPRLVKAARAASRMATFASGPGQVYTGTGFDACSTPSQAAMSAWASTYRMAAVYIGGANMACAQRNLTGTWVSAVSTAGWHLVPIYVGLQAPSNSCGCAGISPGAATSQGTAAAEDAVAQAQARGLGPGNPIYFDMEAYSRTAANSTAVRTFLAAWTAELHALGYSSGAYGSQGSGIADLVAADAAGQTVPDDLWIANWNGQKTTADSAVPSGDWAIHQRLHQYAGGHNETHGGVTLNVDSDYVDAATAATGGAVTASTLPASVGEPSISGTAVGGQVLTEHHAPWSGGPSSYADQWEACDSAGTACAPIPGATGTRLKLGPAQLGQTIRVSEVAANTFGTAAAVTSAATQPVLAAPGAGFWTDTAHGNVYKSGRMASYGSPLRARVTSFAGMAPTADGGGYWLATSGGRVFAYGDAARAPGVRPAHPVVGVAGAPGGGYWLVTSHGNVYPRAGAPFYGSPVRTGVSTVVGLAPTADGRGYWVVTSGGRVFAYGDAARVSWVRPAHPLIGISR
jgi:hypothetical protein